MGDGTWNSNCFKKFRKDCGTCCTDNIVAPLKACWKNDAFVRCRDGCGEKCTIMSRCLEKWCCEKTLKPCCDKFRKLLERCNACCSDKTRRFTEFHNKQTTRCHNPPYICVCFLCACFSCMFST